MPYTKLSLTADKNNTLKQGRKLRGCPLMIRPTARDAIAVLGVCAHV